MTKEKKAPPPPLSSLWDFGRETLVFLAWPRKGPFPIGHVCNILKWPHEVCPKSFGAMLEH